MTAHRARCALPLDAYKSLLWISGGLARYIIRPREISCSVHFAVTASFCGGSRQNAGRPTEKPLHTSGNHTFACNGSPTGVVCAAQGNKHTPSLGTGKGGAIDTLTAVTLDKVGITVVLNKLARKKGRAQDLYSRLMGSWGHRPDRQRVTIKLGERDLQVLESLNLRSGILG